MTRRRRGLSDEERQLWDKIAETARPLRPRRPTPPAKPETARETEAKPRKAVPAAVKAVPMPKPTAKPAQAPLVGIDRRLRAKLSRGSLEVDARIDLHGLTQSSAHLRLRRFLEEAQSDGVKLVLVITGKGKPADEVHHGEERGVLKRAVPGWLSGAEFRHLVASFDEAGRRHGGGGALYVRLRKKR